MKKSDSCSEVISIVQDLTNKLSQTVSDEKNWLEKFKATQFENEHQKEIQKMLVDSHEMHIQSKSNMLEILKFAIDTDKRKKELKKTTKKKLKTKS
ncbi:MAG: hypothetical protein KGI28_08715 [Thaumarchaeota archaeon]|nr:hypothetical protein [Nitrososphaerota archaeon]